LQAHGQWHWSLGQAFSFFSLLTTKTLLLSMVVSCTSKVVSSVLELELDEEDSDVSDVSEVDDEEEEEEEEEDDEEWVSVWLLLEAEEEEAAWRLLRPPLAAGCCAPGCCAEGC